MENSPENSRSSTSSWRTAPRLPWLPITSAQASAWTAGLADYETGWFWRLIFSSLLAERQGYLLDSSNLWMLTGAKRSDFWESQKSRVLACWEIGEVDGTRMLWFPPLVEMIDEQRSKLRKPRSSLSPLSSSENQNQNQREREPRAKNEEPHDRKTATQQDPSGLDRLIPRRGERPSGSGQ